jgi:hypothetical protein
MDGPCLQNGCIESAQAPSRRRWIPGFHFLIIDRLLNARSVGVQRLARRAEFSDLEENLADAVTLADADGTPVQAARREILSERAVIQRKTLFLELVDAFGRDDEDGLAGAAVDLGMRVSVAGNAEWGDYSSRDRTLGHAAWRNVDLENGRRGHFLLF